MKFKELKKILPKYKRNYLYNKKGDILQSQIFLYYNKHLPEELRGLNPNDSRLDNRRVVKLFTISQGNYWYSKGAIGIVIE